MRHTKRLTLTAFSLLLATTAPWVFGATLTNGPWTATLDGTGPQVIAYKGEPIIRRGALTGFLPEWKGGRFFMDGSQLTTTETTATWHKHVEGNQEALLKLELTPKGCRFSLDTTITAAGPSEFSVEIAPEAVRTVEDHCFVWMDGEPQFLDLVGTFPATGGINELRFERADRTVTVRCTGFQMQDRRRGGGDMFLVQVIGSEGVEPRKASASIEIEVQEADPATSEARGVALSQKPRDVKDLPVANPGFESTKLLDSWTENPLASLDTATKHSGRQSTRLTLREDVAKREHVYLIQNVPVREKGLYQAMAWIKSEQVEAAQVGGMSPTGATIIIEFADKQGKWLASGSYAGGLYGTTDWRWVATEVAQAPPGAGSAVIFLALRGIGTAWFDDVALSEVNQHVIKLSPLPGQRVADNTPTFNWHYGWKTPATLELCQEVSFPAEKVISIPKIESLPIALEKHIPPGKWFWRVRVPDHDVVSTAWEFAQTVDLTRDTTEPKIEHTYGWLSNNQPIRIRYSDNVGVTRVRLTVDGQEVSSQVRWSKTIATFAPQRGWTEGLHKVLVQVSDAAGNTAERKLFFTHSKPRPKTVWQQVGGVKTGGRKRFLFGMYGVRIQDMQEIAAGGFDFVHNYQWDGPGTNEEALRYLDAAQKNSLQAFIGIWRQQLMKGNEEFVAERVGALMNHPGLFAWYLYDEPDIQFQYVSPEWLTRYYKLIKALDP
ncbi:MAG: hypothetical protein HY318_17185, partial [Armatimonadetes bacterium]|nr:hypothetical protein [Armatimonadota bacterium]